MADAARERVILELAKAGAKMSEIVNADPDGRSEAEVREDLDRILTRKHPGVSPEMALEMERLDQVNRSIWVQAVKGEPGAARQALQVSSARRQLLREAAEAQAQESPAQRLRAGLQRFSDFACNTSAGGGDTPDGSATPTREDHTDG